MPIYLWNKSLVLGITDVDSQHRQLINALRELQIGLYDEMSAEEVQRQLQNMVNYCAEHFATEEALMEPHKDSMKSYEKHLAEHAEFCNVAVRLQADFEEKGASIATDIFQFLANWLEKHIKGTDKDMCEELFVLTGGRVGATSVPSHALPRRLFNDAVF